jgi:phosphate transport system substrate-binding protein
MRWRSLVPVALLLAGCTRSEKEGPSGVTTTTGAERPAISVKGSDTMVILGQRWAERYMKEHPGAIIQVTGGGSGTGIAALINGTTDICQASRAMKDKERENVNAKRGAPAVETAVALDAVAVYVNKTNPVEEISLPALAKIYLGETTSWKDVGGSDRAIILYGRENNSGTYVYFKEHVLQNKDFAAATQTLAGTSAVANAVKGDPFGIGYGGIGYAGGIRALKVKKDDASLAVAPSLETAQDSSYPMSRLLFFYTAGQPQGTTKTFIDWVRTAPGQEVTRDVGYYPLPARK